MTPIEVMAFLLAILIIVKLVILFIHKESWMKFADMVYGKPIVAMIVSLMLAAIVLNYLLVEVNIVQIFAVMLFTTLLMVIGFEAYAKEMLEFAHKVLKDEDLIKRSWLSVTIWILLVIWVLYALFG